jgi:4-hydroxy-2-oxoglutarate aldolase
MLDSGILPPLPTPFTGDGALELGLLRALVARLNEAPLAGYLALGSNGEAGHVTPEEAAAVFRAVREAAAPGRTMLAGTGQQSTWATMEMTKRAAEAGADAALVLTPYYYRNVTTEEALVRHYAAVADAAPIPIYLYNVPANTGLNMPPGVASALAAHGNVLGIKDSAGDVGQLAELVRVTRHAPGFRVFSGNFGSALPGYALGVAGAVLAVANVFPDEVAAIHRLFHEGRLAEARALHLRLLPIARFVTSGHSVPGLKAALERVGTPAGAPRAPLLPLDAKRREELERLLSEARA